MLVLSRKEGTWLDIERGRIRIQVVELRGSRVVLGIEAPREVQVARGEIVDNGKEQKHD